LNDAPEVRQSRGTAARRRVNSPFPTDKTVAPTGGLFFYISAQRMKVYERVERQQGVLQDLLHMELQTGAEIPYLPGVQQMTGILSVKIKYHKNLAMSRIK